MPNRAERKVQNGARTEKLPRLRLLSFVPTSSVVGKRPVMAMRNGLDVQRDQGFKVRSLRELEAENAELRNTAIQLALEIQDLRTVRLAAN
jgi:hypothetical protein